MKFRFFAIVFTLGALLAQGGLADGQTAVKTGENKESDCEQAVDMADSHDFEDFHNCHQEKTGINRLLNRLVKGDAKSAQPSGSPGSPQSAQAIIVDSEALASQRFLLLQQMTRKCDKGFRIEAEEYRAHSTGGLILNFHYECLE